MNKTNKIKIKIVGHRKILPVVSADDLCYSCVELEKENKRVKKFFKIFGIVLVVETALILTALFGYGWYENALIDQMDERCQRNVIEICTSICKGNK